MDEHSTTPARSGSKTADGRLPAGISLVPLHADHLDALAEIERMAFSKPWSYDALAEELQNPLAVFFVAEDVRAEKAVGYIGMYHILNEGFITNIVVHPGCRRQGIASALLEEVIEYAKAKDIERLTLEVRESNEDAVMLYEKFGFEQDGIRTGFYDSPKENALIMSLYNQDFPT